jgi:hypothetical protein
MGVIERERKENDDQHLTWACMTSTTHGSGTCMAPEMPETELNNDGGSIRMNAIRANYRSFMITEVQSIQRGGSPHARKRENKHHDRQCRSPEGQSPVLYYSSIVILTMISMIISIWLTSTFITEIQTQEGQHDCDA